MSDNVQIETPGPHIEAVEFSDDIGTWNYEIDSNRVFADKNLARLFGVTDEEAAGGGIESYLKAVHADDRPQMTEIIENAISRGTTYKAEYRLVQKDSSIRFVVATGKVLRDESGRALSLPGVVLDITDRKRFEKALRNSEERRRLAIDSAGIGSWNIDLKTNVMAADGRFCEIFGLAIDQCSFEQAVAVIHPHDRQRVLDAVAAASRPIDSVPYAEEYRVIHSDESIVWVSAKGRANFEQVGGKPVLTTFDGTIIDITERKRHAAERETLLQAERAARSEAERVGRMKDEFLATLSHELRTPLNAILGWAQILSNGEQSGEDYRHGLEIIERNARSQAELIEDLLDMSRIISGKLRLDVREVDPTAFINAAIETIGPAADAKAIRIKRVLDPKAGPVSGDANRLQQVVWNLISNAIKFTPKGGNVQVRLERVNSQIEVSIADSGQGIAPEFLLHVFDRFRQADGSTTRKVSGLGLGLAIVKQLVELHGGSVRVSSAGEGRGATFTMALPVKAVHDLPDESVRVHPAARQRMVFRPIRLQGLKVLIVDDEPDARDLLKRLLTDCDAVVSIAASAAEAMESIRSQIPDVLVSDIGMSEMDGYELVKRVRALAADSGGKIPAVALTAFARSEDRARALLAGYSAHVAKPVDPMELVATVAAVSGRIC